METLFDEENLESIYNILKGENKELTKATLRSVLEKIGSNDLTDLGLEKGKDNYSDDFETISLDTFKSIIQEVKNLQNENNKQDTNENITENSNNTSLDELNSEIIVYLRSGFDLIDYDKKGYLNLDDLKKLNKVLKMQFSDDDLEGLFEIASKNNQQLTFPKFVKFLTTETNL